MASFAAGIIQNPSVSRVSQSKGIIRLDLKGNLIKTSCEAGFKVISVAQTAKGIKDENVIQLALQHNYLLLTEDKDFGGGYLLII